MRAAERLTAKQAMLSVMPASRTEADPLERGVGYLLRSWQVHG